MQAVVTSDKETRRMKTTLSQSKYLYIKYRTHIYWKTYEEYLACGGIQRYLHVATHFRPQCLGTLDTINERRSRW